MPDPDQSTPFSERLRWRLGLVAVLVVGLAIASPYLYRAWKAARAQSHAREALELAKAGEIKKARDLANAAFHLAPQSASSLRARSRTAASPVDALVFSSALLNTREAMPDDLRHYLNTCLELNFSADTDHVLRKLLDAEPSNIENWNLASRMLLLKGQLKAALDCVDRGLALAPDNRTAKLLAGQLALRSDRQEFRDAGARALRDLIAAGQDDESLQALVALVTAAPTSAADAAAIAQQLSEHPLAQTHHKLLAIQALRSSAPDPASKAALVESAVHQFGETHLAILLDWLNAQGLHARSLALLEFEQASAKRELFKPWCKAMIAAGRSDTLIALIEADRTGVPISSEDCELVSVDAYEAQGKTEVAETHWNIALRAAGTGNRKASLLHLAQWAERRDYDNRALAAYERLLAASPEFTPHCYDRITDLARRTDQLPRLRTITHGLMVRVPDNAVYRQNYAYLSVLAGDDLDTARELLAELLAEHPELQSARCTLALLEKTRGDHDRCAELLGQVPPEALDVTDRYLWDLLSGAATAEPDGLSTLEREAFRRLQPVSVAIPREP